MTQLLHKRPTSADWALALAVALGAALLWGAGLALTRDAPALDSAEQLLWGYSMEAGYWKHPPVPSWIMHALLGAFGPSVSLTYFAAQACAGVALLLAWRLGCEFMPPLQSLAAMALSALVTWHNLSADTFNHNTVLLPFQAAAALAFWLAVRSGNWLRWFVFGLAAAAAMLVKYIALLPLSALFLYFLVERSARTRRNLAGLAVAGAGALLLLAPHMLWLAGTGAAPLHYATEVAAAAPKASEWWRSLGLFLLEQCLDLAPLALLLFWLYRHAPAGPAPEAPGSRRFLWCAGAAPLVMIVMYSVFTGTELQARWGSTLCLFAGWLALDAGRRLTALPPQRVLRAALCAQAALLAYGALLAPGALRLLDFNSRVNFPSRQLTAMANATWHQFNKAPLRILVTDSWLGGNVVANSPRPLAVVIDGYFQRAAWVTAEDVRRCGALVIRDPGAGPEVVQALRGFLEEAQMRGRWRLPWSPNRGLHRVDPEGTVLDWGILPPSGDGACTL